MKIGQKVKTQDSKAPCGRKPCEAEVFRITGDKVYIHIAWYSSLDYMSDYHEYKWFDKSFIEPLLITPNLNYNL